LDKQISYFAELKDNIVLRTIAINTSEILDENGQESEGLGIAFCQNLFGGEWKQTFENSSIRKNYAMDGDIYDEVRNAYIKPKPEDTQYGKYVFDEESCKWVFKVDETIQQPPNVITY
jgi:hypothetical protein